MILFDMFPTKKPNSSQDTTVTNTKEMDDFMGCMLGTRVVCTKMYKSETEAAKCHEDFYSLCRMYLKTPDVLKTMEDDRNKRNRI